MSPYLSRHDRGRGGWASPDVAPIKRFYRADPHGPRCSICNTPMDPKLHARGETTHPMCDPAGRGVNAARMR